jgi:glycerol-3-phosphate acyltransferase PlsY
LAGAATLVLDVVKGYAAVAIAGHLTGSNQLWMSAAALAVMAGHAYPVFLRFRGGKAVATFYGAFLRLTPVPLAAVVVVFLVVAAWTRHISLGSIVAAATFPLAAWLIAQASWPVEGAAVLAAAFVIYRHRSNIQRLRRGSEHTFSLGAKRQ